MLKFIGFKSNLIIVNTNNKINSSSNNSNKVNKNQKNKFVKKKNWLKLTKSKILVKLKNQDFSFKSKNINI